MRKIVIGIDNTPFNMNVEELSLSSSRNNRICAWVKGNVVFSWDCTKYTLKYDFTSDLGVKFYTLMTR